MDLDKLWAERLGIESAEGVGDELAARFEHLTRFVLAGGMPPAGRPASAEAATVYGDLWVLTGFMTDAKRLLHGQEVPR